MECKSSHILTLSALLISIVLTLSVVYSIKATLRKIFRWWLQYSVVHPCVTVAHLNSLNAALLFSMYICRLWLWPIIKFGGTGHLSIIHMRADSPSNLCDTSGSSLLTTRMCDPVVPWDQYFQQNDCVHLIIWTPILALCLCTRASASRGENNRVPPLSA